MNRLREETYYLRQMLYRLGIVFGMLTLIRLLFYVSNFSFFKLYPAQKILLSFVVGWRFDLSSLAYANLLFVFLSLFPSSVRDRKGYQYLLAGIFFICNGLMLALEIPDIEYYKFAQRRSCVNEFNLLGDFVRLIPEFIKDYWYLWALLPLMFLFFAKLYSWKFWPSSSLNTNRLVQSGILLAGLALSVVAGRGGLQLRPITPTSAGATLRDARLIPLATNTTLNFIYSLQQETLQESNYYPEAELDKRFDLKRHAAARGPFRPMNVMLIIMESMGTEYVMQQPDGKVYAPFFDSLSRYGIRFDRAYANAQRSAQGIVSITSGIPALMDEAFHFSPFQGNNIESIAFHLKKRGYSTAFFHGSNPGSMDFERFATLTGYDAFYDRADYPDEKDYDGSWGIWDIPFFNWTVEQADRMPKPFFATLFSLTSHNPYKVENWFESKHPGEDKILRSVRYSDEALRQLFRKASTLPWFRNTLFVICADHTGQPFGDAFKTREGMFRVPILYYSPDTTLITPSMLAENPRKSISSQVDIMPTVLDLLQYPDTFHCFGYSVFRDKDPLCFQFNNGIYQIVDGTHILLFDGTQVAGMYDYQKDPFLEHDLANGLPEIRDHLLEHLKAVIQRYQRAMVRNELNR